MFLETVSLVLSHADISTTTTLNNVSNNVGSWKLGKQSTTWNFDLKQLLGSVIYDKHDVFELRLNQLSYATSDFTNNSINQQLIINLSGLDFSNSSYNVKSKNNSATCRLMLLNMSESAQTVDLSPNIAMCNFNKSSNTNVNLTIELIRTIDNLPAIYTTNPFPHSVYNFDIYGI